MPRFTMNRRWTFILTVIALAIVTMTYVAAVSADVIREGSGTGGAGDIGGGGTPISGGGVGGGDPDQPVPNSLKYQQHGQLRSGGDLSLRTVAGDNRFEGNVWMWRLSVMGRVLQAYWIRL